jgi:hypothetical protein
MLALALQSTSSSGMFLSISFELHLFTFSGLLTRRPKRHVDRYKPPKQAVLRHIIKNVAPLF